MHLGALGRTLCAAALSACWIVPAMADDPTDTSPDMSSDMPAMKRPMMAGALGAYAFTRDASGTSWQPDASVHEGLHIMTDDWMIMAHARINAVYDWQQGPRGGEDEFVSGMVMGMARRTFEDDAVSFRVMLSPDPAMGPAGYPLLLASGETANGVTPLIDRQHPHDLAMELSTTYSHMFSQEDSAFVYVGWPGEPAFGPPAFMHRLSIMDSPAAPITHHWLDSTHITFGVVTGGFVHDDWKVEMSGFKGREPDQNRTDMESFQLDSTAARLSWNPTENLALQVSWAHLISPEQLEPTLNQTRYSASAIYTVALNDGWWSTTAAWGQRRSENALITGPALNAFALESAVKFAEPWTIYGRIEEEQTDELSGNGRVDEVGKVSLGIVHDWRVAPHVKLGLGGEYSLNWVSGALAPAYGGSTPSGAMVFVRLLVD